MRPTVFSPSAIAVVIAAAVCTVYAADPLPPTVPGSSSAPAPSPGASRTPSATISSQQSLGANGKKGMPGNRLEKLKEELSLTPAQLTQIRPIFKKAGEEMKAVHNNSSLTQEQKHQKMRAIVMAAVQQMKPILTQAQLAKLKDLHKQHAKTTASA